MKIFNKHLHDITYDEIISFCNEGHIESLYLDYKEDVSRSNSVAKTSAAMANSFGGIIIIGVADDNNYPKLPVKGLDKLTEEQITQIISDNTFPLITPEIKVYKKANRYLGIVRVKPSQSTPIFFTKDNTIPVRVNNITKKFEDNADLKQLDWLWNNRKKSIELYENCLSFARDTFEKQRSNLHGLESLIEAKKDPYSPRMVNSKRLLRDPHYFPNRIEIFSRPIYPDITPLKNPKELNDIFPKINVNVDENCGEFPRNIHKRRRISGGSIIQELKSRGLIYTEINQYGLYYHNEKIIMQDYDLMIDEHYNIDHLTSEAIAVLKWPVLKGVFISFLESLKLFYKEIEYYGYIEIGIKLFSVNTMQLIKEQIETELYDSPLGAYSVDDYINWDSGIINVSEIDNNLINDLEEYIDDLFDYKKR